jgi:hypothetical protein
MDRIAFGSLLLVSLVALVLQLVFDQPIVGALGVVLLGVPAYALTRTAGPRPLGRPEILLVTLGGAVAINVLLGTVASLFPAGLSARSVAVLELSILAAIALSWGRTSPARLASINSRAGEGASTAPRRGGRLPRASTVLLGGVGLVLGGAGVAIAARSADDQAHPGFVQFWSLPGTGGSAATVGITNQFGVQLDCTVAIDRPDRPGLTWHPAALASGQTVVGLLPTAAADETAPWRLALSCAGVNPPVERQLNIDPPR